MAWKLRSHVTLGNEMKEIKMAVTDMVKIILHSQLTDTVLLCVLGGYAQLSFAFSVKAHDSFSTLGNAHSELLVKDFFTMHIHQKCTMSF